ncbi:MAG: gliding motility-associated C-terminal domain-containing protein [Luteibaculum sp.]
MNKKLGILFCLSLLIPTHILAQLPPPDAFLEIHEFPASILTENKALSARTSTDEVYTLIPGPDLGGFCTEAWLFRHNHLAELQGVQQLQFQDAISFEHLIIRAGTALFFGRYRYQNNLGDSLKSLYVFEVGNSGQLINSREIRMDDASVEILGEPAIDNRGRIYIPNSAFRNDGINPPGTAFNITVLNANLDPDTSFFFNGIPAQSAMTRKGDSSMVFLSTSLILSFDDSLRITAAKLCTGANCPEDIQAATPFGRDSLIVGGNLSTAQNRSALFITDSSLTRFTPLVVGEGQFNTLFTNEVGQAILNTSSNDNPCFFRLNENDLSLMDTVKIDALNIGLSGVTASGLCGAKYLLAGVETNLRQPVFSKLDSSMSSYCGDSTALVFTNPAAGLIQDIGSIAAFGDTAVSFPFAINLSPASANIIEQCSSRNCNMVSLPPNVLVCNGEDYIIAPTINRDPCSEEQPGDRVYVWDYENETGETVTISENGTYTIEANESGCPPDLATVNVRFDRQFLNFSPPYRICPEEGDSVEITGTGFPNIVWSTGETSNSITVDSVGSYGVRAVSNLGCIRNATVEVNEFCPPECWVANAFTPNGDGVNDVFRPVTLFVEEYDFRIFNRWGKEVFSSTDPEEAWDGDEAKGIPAPIDVYVWKLVINSVYKGQIYQEVKLGHVALVR